MTTAYICRMDRAGLSPAKMAILLNPLPRIHISGNKVTLHTDSRHCPAGSFATRTFLRSASYCTHIIQEGVSYRGSIEHVSVLNNAWVSVYTRLNCSGNKVSRSHKTVPSTLTPHSRQGLLGIKMSEVNKGNFGSLMAFQGKTSPSLRETEGYGPIIRYADSKGV